MPKNRFDWLYRVYDETEGEQPKTVTVKVVEEGGKTFYVDDRGQKLVPQGVVDREVGDARRKANERAAAMAEELRAIRDAQGTSDSLRAELEARIEELQTVSMTKEQQAQAALLREKTRFEAELKTLAQERDQATKRFEEQLVSSAIATHSAQHNAYNPEQIYGLLRPNTSVKPVVDAEGNPTGGYEVLATIVDVDKEGQPFSNTLPVDKAVQRMVELPERYGNLFKSKDGHGLGHRGSQIPDSRGAGLDVSSFAAYEASVKKNPHLVTQRDR